MSGKAQVRSVAPKGKQVKYGSVLGVAAGGIVATLMSYLQNFPIEILIGGSLIVGIIVFLTARQINPSGA